MNVKWRVKCGEWHTMAEQRAAAYRLLADLLGNENVIVQHDADGAPFLPDHPNLNISISHCRKAVAVAVSSRGRVGIDVECRRKVGEGLVKRVCSPAEQEAIQRSDDPEMAFLRYWTRKEAVLKMRGTGIRGFGSMVEALCAKDIVVEDIQCELRDVVCSLAR